MRRGVVRVTNEEFTRLLGLPPGNKVVATMPPDFMQRPDCTYVLIDGDDMPKTQEGFLPMIVTVEQIRKGEL